MWSLKWVGWSGHQQALVGQWHSLTYISSANQFGNMRRLRSSFANCFCGQLGFGCNYIRKDGWMLWPYVWFKKKNRQNSQTLPQSPQNKTVSFIFVIIILLSFLISELVLIMTMYSILLTSQSPIRFIPEPCLGILRNAQCTKSLKVSCWRRWRWPRWVRYYLSLSMTQSTDRQVFLRLTAAFPSKRDETGLGCHTQGFTCWRGNRIVWCNTAGVYQPNPAA